MTETLNHTDDLRRLVTVEQISEIRPIPDADAIEQAIVKGWSLVVKKGEFGVGDAVVYFEVDSMLPMDDERFAFLAPRGTKTVDDRDYHRLKTARLRGVYSQGLVIGLDQFPEILEILMPTDERGSMLTLADEPKPDFAALLGVFKYEPPMPDNLSFIGEFPTHIVSKTDSERAQNLANDWDKILATGPWDATEKVDGTSATFILDADGTRRLAGRNWEIDPTATNVYTRAADLSGIFDQMEPGDVVQGEIVGPGVQKNGLDLPDLTVVVFAIKRGGRLLPRDEWFIEQSDRLRVANLYLTIEPLATAEQTINAIDGIKSLINPKRLAEGVVFHHRHGQEQPFLGYRSTFKVISNKWLLKNE